MTNEITHFAANFVNGWERFDKLLAYYGVVLGIDGLNPPNGISLGYWEIHISKGIEKLAELCGKKLITPCYKNGREWAEKAFEIYDIPYCGDILFYEGRIE